VIDLLYAGAAGGGGAQQGNPIMTLLPFLAIILVMYFLMIRPQAKKQKDKQRMLQDLQPGDEILTIGGIYGRIEGIKKEENILIVKICKDIKINISRSAVAEKLVNKSVVR
jgi:preprotein translocase subunit YajC